MSDHSVVLELSNVHHKVLARYQLEQEVAAQSAKAKKMEQYLRMFKAVGNQHGDKIVPGFQSELETQALEQLSLEVGKALGIGEYSLFRNQHHWYRKRQSEWGADDVFEAELATLLDVVLEKASNGMVSAADSGAQLIGNIAGNLASDYIQEVTNQVQSIVTKTTKKSQLITPPQARAGKVDVKGYSANFDISATIDPKWQEFITLFQGVNCTVKNYSSTSSTEVIHLGKSNPQKAIIGTLSDLQYDSKDAVHIYCHSINSYNSSKHKSEHHVIGSHITHLRFVYELTGGGLYVKVGDADIRLDDADFFIYNDPASNNIWVRSTKEMISNITSYTTQSMGDPFTSGIVVLKQSFN